MINTLSVTPLVMPHVSETTLVLVCHEGVIIKACDFNYISEAGIPGRIFLGVVFSWQE